MITTEQHPQPLVADSDWVPPAHPGEVLQEEFLAPLELSAYRLARDIGVPLPRVAAILKGKRTVTPDTALRLGAYTGTGPEFWLNLQAHYDLQMAQRALPESQLAEIARRRPTAVV